MKKGIKNAHNFGFNDMADVVRLYSKKPEAAEQRLANLLSEVMYEDSESV